MLLTEQEAASKRCQESYGPPLLYDPSVHPHGLTSAIGAVVVGAIHSPSHCIGSSCMAWRWRDDPCRLSKDDPPPRGFCGKAIQPIMFQ